MPLNGHQFYLPLCRAEISALSMFPASLMDCGWKGTCCCPASQAFRLTGKPLQFSGPAVCRWQAFSSSVKEKNHKVLYLQGSTCYMWQDCCDICVTSRISSVLHTIDDPYSILMVHLTLAASRHLSCILVS